MCDQAPACACKVRVASFGSAAIGTGVAAVAITVMDHLLLVGVVFAVAAVAAGVVCLVLRRAAVLSVRYWPAMEQRRRVALPARPARVLPARAARALPASRPVPGVVAARDDGERIGR